MGGCKRTALVALALLLVALPPGVGAAGPGAAVQGAAAETVDLAMMTRIRQEGFENSKVMETLEYLTDVLGPRLTGSPGAKKASEWTRDRFTSWGLSNAHLEEWGPFGRGWSMEHVSVHMTAPQAAPLIALPKAWTPGTKGAVKGKVIRVEKLPSSAAELDQWKGKLAGAILLVGEQRKLELLTVPLTSRRSQTDLDKLTDFDLDNERSPFDREDALKRFKFQKTLNQFLIDQKVLATVESSGWDRGVVRIGAGGSRQPGEPVGVPSLVMAAEHFNRIARLVAQKIPVELELDVRANFHDADQMSYNTIAEIPGTDPSGEVVLLGAHLDSWHPATGATDNGAGSAVVMEAIRILKALDVKPKRTIRVVLWTGEEQGLLGSRAYVASHFASRPEPTDPEQKNMPSFLRTETGPLTVKPEHEKVSVYFNLDNGAGKIRGIYAEKNAAAVPIFKAWLEPFADLGASTVTMDSTGSTDHVSFDRVGLPGFQFVQDGLEYSSRDTFGLTHHSNMDVYDRAPRADMMQASVIMAAFVYNAATRDAMFPRKPMPKDPPTKQ